MAELKTRHGGPFGMVVAFSNYPCTKVQLICCVRDHKKSCMRFIPTKVHGFLDYSVGAFVAASPWILGFAAGGAETWVPFVLGISSILYSLITDYELGVSKVLSMGSHLALDLSSGILLAASPWLFGFANELYLPHLVMGLFEIVASLTTKKKPRSGRQGGLQPRHSHA
jgi:hypothetical protein